MAHSTLLRAMQVALMVGVAAAAMGATRHQGGIAGRYTLRSVDGETLPAKLVLEDKQHSLVITNGVLELTPNGRYVCRTSGETVTMGLHEPFVDSLTGGYTVVQGTAITLGKKGGLADTLQANGFQFSWAHGVRQGFARFVYSR